MSSLQGHMHGNLLQNKNLLTNMKHQKYMTEYYKKNTHSQNDFTHYFVYIFAFANSVMQGAVGTVLPAKRYSDFMFCLQSYQGLIIDSSLVY